MQLSLKLPRHRHLQIVQRSAQIIKGDARFRRKLIKASDGIEHPMSRDRKAIEMAEQTASLARFGIARAEEGVPIIG